MFAKILLLFSFAKIWFVKNCIVFDNFWKRKIEITIDIVKWDRWVSCHHEIFMDVVLKHHCFVQFVRENFGKQNNEWRQKLLLLNQSSKNYFCKFEIWPYYWNGMIYRVFLKTVFWPQEQIFEFDNLIGQSKFCH